MIGGAAFAIVGLLFLLSAIHLFTATLYQSLFGRLPNTSLGAIAFAVFATSLLAVLTAGRLGPRRAIAATAFALAVCTLGFTAIRQEWIDLVLAAVAVIAGTQWLALLHAARAPGRPSPLGVALPCAIAIDVGLRAITATIPVVAAPAVLAVPLVLIASLLFLAGGIAVLGEPLTWATPGARGALGLLAVGPLLLAAETGATNGAQLALAGGLGLDGGPSTQVGLLVAGIGIAAGAFVLARGLPARPTAAAAIAVGATLMWAHVPVLSLAAGAAFAAGILIAANALTSAAQGEAKSPWVAVVGLGIGWVLFVAGAFVHYAYFANLEALWLLTAVVVVAVLVVPPSPLPRWRPAVAVLVAAIAVVAPAAGLLLAPVPSSVSTSPLTFRVMTYNVHQGFDAFDIAGLDRTADTIAHEGPDVLVLQEVVRGWLIDEQHDVLGYLSARLGMPYVFGPNVGDLYGNAILSRYPITDVRRIHYAKEPGLRYQPRGAIIVRIGDGAAATRALIAVTHLDENPDASVVRMEQVRTLLDEIGKATPAIIACDCNAKPEAPELQLIAESGFGDLALQSSGGGPTFPAELPVERIDYIFGVGVTASQGHVVNSTASDHRAVVVNVTLMAR